MKGKYLSLKQAREIARESQSIIGAPLDADNNIEHVIIAPYSRILQWAFVHKFLQGDSLSDLLNGYDGDRFDVIAVAKAENDRGFHIRPVREIGYASDAKPRLARS